MFQGKIKKGITQQKTTSTFGHTSQNSNPFGLQETQRLNEKLDTFLPKHNLYKIYKSQQYVKEQKQQNLMQPFKNLKRTGRLAQTQSNFDKSKDINPGKIPDYSKASQQMKDTEHLFRGTSQSLVNLKGRGSLDEGYDKIDPNLKNFIELTTSNNNLTQKQYSHKLQPLETGKELLQKLDQKRNHIKNKRGHMQQNFTLLNEEAFNKFDHSIKIMNMLENDISDKIKEYPGVFSIAERVTDAFGQIGNTFQRIYEQIQSQHKDIQQLNDLVSAQNERLDNLMEQKDEITKMLAEKSKLLKKFMVENDPKSKIGQKNSNFLGLENQKLGDILVQLSQKVKDIETGQDGQELEDKVSKLQYEIKKQQNEFLTDIDNTKKEYQKQKAAHTTLHTQFQRLSNELNSLQTKYEQSQNDLEYYSRENAINLANANKYREQGLMQFEDLICFLQKTQSDKAMIHRLTAKCSELKSRLDKFHLQRSKEVEIPVSDQAIEETDRFLGKWDKTYREEQTYKLQLFDQMQEDKQLMNDPIKDNIMQKWKDTVQNVSSKYEQIDLKKLRINYPNFYIFIEPQLKHCEVDIKNIHTGQRKISLSYIGTMRMMLDSKYREIINCGDNYSLISRFPDFVYSWFEKYVVDDKTRKLRFANKSEIMQADELRATFLLDLLNPKLQTLWEFITFKEFLGEYASKDEIFFYLHCRSLLFEGNVMDHTNSPFEVIKYVTLAQADKLLDCIMKKFEPMSLVHLKTEIREKIKKKVIIKQNPQTKEKNEVTLQLIDSGMVLRLLLQFYRIERENRYKNFQEAFGAVQSIDKHGKFTVSFHNFKKILEMTYPNVLGIEIAQLYRECYCLGQGVVSVEGFFSLASDNGFFIKHLKLPGYLIQQPILEEIKQKIQVPNDELLGGGVREEVQIQIELTNDDLNSQYNFFLTTYENLKPMIQPLFEIGKMFGVESLTSDIQQIESLIDTKFKKPDIEQVFKGKPLIFWTHKIMKIVQDIKNIAYQSTALHNKHTDYFLFDLEQMVTNDFSVLETTLRTCEDYIKTLKFEEDNKNKKISRVQNAFMFKIKKFYSFVSSLLQANYSNQQALNKANKMEKNKKK